MPRSTRKHETVGRDKTARVYRDIQSRRSRGETTEKDKAEHARWMIRAIMADAGGVPRPGTRRANMLATWQKTLAHHEAEAAK